MVAVVFTGVVLGEIGTVYLVLFFLTSLVCTALVELRGLFLTVVAVPFYWFAGIGLVGYFTDRASLSGTNRKTAAITALYPSVENYLWLVATFAVCLLVAVIRQRLDAAARERAARIARARRQRTAAADEDNRRVASRVRDIERSADRDRAAERERIAERARAAECARSAGRTRTGAADGGPESPREPRRTPRTVTRPRRTPENDQGVRTRTAEELRAASERRRAREAAARDALRDDDRPLDLG